MSLPEQSATDICNFSITWARGTKSPTQNSLVPPGPVTEKLQMSVETAQLSTLSTYNMPLPSWIFSKRFLKQMKKNINTETI